LEASGALRSSFSTNAWHEAKVGLAVCPELRHMLWESDEKSVEMQLSNLVGWRYVARG